MSLITDLERLADLHQSGALTQAEFNEAKQMLLHPTDAPSPARSEKPAPSPADVLGQQRATSPAKRKAWGRVAMVLGSLGFIAGASGDWKRSIEGAILAGCLNPMFFIGFPLGLYWVRTANAHEDEGPAEKKRKHLAEVATMIEEKSDNKSSDYYTIIDCIKLITVGLFIIFLFMCFLNSIR